MLVTPCTRETALSMMAVICASMLSRRRAGVAGAHGHHRAVDVGQLADLDALVGGDSRQ